MILTHLVMFGFWDGAGGSVTSSAPTVTDAYGAGRDWKGLADAEYHIHKIGVTDRYKKKLELAVEDAPKLRKEPEEIPEWLEDFLEEEDLRTHIAAMDLLFSRIDQRLEDLVRAWLERELLEQDEEDVVMLLLN